MQPLDALEDLHALKKECVSRVERRPRFPVEHVSPSREIDPCIQRLIIGRLPIFEGHKNPFCVSFITNFNYDQHAKQKEQLV